MTKEREEILWACTCGAAGVLRCPEGTGRILTLTAGQESHLHCPEGQVKFKQRRVQVGRENLAPLETWPQFDAYIPVMSYIAVMCLCGKTDCKGGGWHRFVFWVSKN